MSLAAYDSHDRAQQLLALTERLTALVLKETIALQRRELDASSAEWNEKEKLAQTYRLEMARIASDPSLLAGLDADLKRQLMDATAAFHSQLDAHALALNAMKEISEGLVRSIAEELSTETNVPNGYGTRGTSTGKQYSSGVAVNARA